MNNYELHEKAQQLSDSHSAYTLARMLLEMEARVQKLENQNQQTEGKTHGSNSNS